MAGTVSAGRLAGVPVRLHWSVLIIMLLIGWSLAGQAFPAAYPGRPGWQYAVAGAVAAAAFLLGLLAHEVSHAVVARRNGVPVHGITLWMLGGIAELGGPAPDPGADLRIAGIGPLVSLLLGVGLTALGVGLAAVGSPALLVGVVSWLGWINLLLALFNVLPGAPLDGGRLLRAALWRWRGDRTWAEETAARAGRALGMALIAVGLIGFALNVYAGGLWLALVGWFLLGAANAELRTSRVGRLLAGVRVGDVYTRDPETVAPDLTVQEFIDSRLFTAAHSTFPLVRDNRPEGLLTLRRVKALPAAERPRTLLREIACPMGEVPVASPDEPLAGLVARLGGGTDGRALVLDPEGRLVGIVSPVDVTRALDRAELTQRRPLASAGT